jgi:threonine/homoserine/homoserine lactone efflux protein
MSVLTNILLGVSLAAPVGPVSIEVMRRGLRQGFLSGFLVAIGAVCADTTFLLFIALGLSPVISHPSVQTALSSLGAVVLIYFGYKGIKESFHRKNATRKTDLDTSPLVAGYLVTITNPLAIIWWLGVFGTVWSASVQHLSRPVAFFQSMTVMLGILLWFFVLSWAIHRWRRSVTEDRMRQISVIAGIILIGMGAWFGYITFERLSSLL